MRLNLGCGNRHLEGFVNVDAFEGCGPDLVVDLESFPWPFDSSVAEEIELHHVLEHLGQQTAVFLRVIQEIYRVGRDGCRVHITVPHPNHADFRVDPSHVRSIEPETLAMFSRDVCEFWKSVGASNTPFAEICNVDFEMQHITYGIDPESLRRLAMLGINIPEADAHLYADIFGNLVKVIDIVMVVRKPADSGAPTENPSAMEGQRQPSWRSS